jgi:hypothetical protein
MEHCYAGEGMAQLGEQHPAVDMSSFAAAAAQLERLREDGHAQNGQVPYYYCSYCGQALNLGTYTLTLKVFQRFIFNRLPSS